MSDTYPEVNVTDDIDAVLTDEDIKGIVIAVPTALHYDTIPKELLSNRHVFVEKPLSLNYGDGEKLVQLASSREKVLLVGHVLHYHRLSSGSRG
jgi:UDP-2-acetamido-3-amino-2,3-dideoxy-glucuronate N-acetyltransferase